MAINRVTVTINKGNNVPEDASVNVWHFTSLAVPDVVSATTISNGIAAFYEALAPYLSRTVSRVALAHHIQFAEVTQGGAGAADDSVSKVLWDVPFGIIGSPAATEYNLPGEVAACLSFRGNIAGLTEEIPTGPERPIARRRGRVYLGPLSTVATGGQSNGEPRPNAGFREVVLDAYEVMVVALSGALPAFAHVVYSPTTPDTFIVEEASMDDACDTIRSRGVAPTMRQLRPVEQGIVG